MICKIDKISNSLGLHGRASNQLVELAKKFKSDIRIINEGYDQNTIDSEETESDLDSYLKTRTDKDWVVADASSIMSLLAIAAGPGAYIRICAEGPDEEHAVEALSVLINNKFGEEF